MSKTAPTSRAGKMLVRGLIAVLVLFLIMAVFGDLAGFFVAIGQLLFGWIGFIRRVLPQTYVNGGGVLTGVLALVGVLVLGHFVGRGLWAGWKLRWSLTSVAIVVLMFVAGIAMVGMTHQAVWMAQSDTAMFEDRFSRERANRIRCASNLKQLTTAVTLYARENGGRYPDTLEQLVASEDIMPDVLVCYSSSMERIDNRLVPSERAKRVAAGQTSYVYYGRGLVEPVDPDIPIVAEAAVNHSHEGLNIGLADGRVSWHTLDEAREVLARVGRAPTTRPAR